MRRLYSMATPYLEGEYAYEILKCSRCGFVQAEGPDDDSVLSEAYGSAFHETAQQRADVAPAVLFSEVGRRYPVVRNALDRVCWLLTRFPGTPYRNRRSCSRLCSDPFVITLMYKYCYTT